MPLPTTIRSLVSQEAITKVTRLFNGTVKDVLHELLQNARRAGASRVDIDLVEQGDRTMLSIRDDGRGIADPSVLLSLGRSDWTTQTRQNEDPAGMGVFSLAGRSVEIRSAPCGIQSWRVVVPAEAWEDQRALPIEACDILRGTQILIEAPETWVTALNGAGADCARFYPLPVFLDGEPLARADFLADAVYCEYWEGCVIGVFQGAQAPIGRQGRLNFHGLTVDCHLPHIGDVDRAGGWTVKVDIRDTPNLRLVLPARKEVIAGPALDALLDACRRAIYRVVLGQDHHRLSYASWSEARALGIMLPEPLPCLEAWTPETAEPYARLRGSAVRDQAMIIVPDQEPDVAQSAAPILNDHQLIGATAVCAERGFEGYSWYDALPRLASLRFGFKRGGAQTWIDDAELASPRETGSVTALRLEMTIAVAAGSEPAISTREAPLRMMVRSVDCYGIDDATILVDDQASIDPDELAELLEASLFSPDEDRGADSWETQRSDFQMEARHMANAILLGDEEALRAQLAEAIRRDVSWLVPAGCTMTATVTRGAVEIIMASAAP
ncbi:ATP-binding protein [Sphingobium abikonense]|uniref:ATP-binding protein n=1 Tax=Sphingobium abikonense TaxID=86193 RepID=UPI000AAAF476|nr:ATP-binding protein [Sphingobium abikonense]